MTRLIAEAALIQGVGTPVQEIIGRLNTGTDEVSIAKMHSRKGWSQPGQTRQFNEYILVLKGALRVKTRRKEFVARTGQAIVVPAGEWVEYSAPEAGGARYLAICVPAYSPGLVRKRGQSASGRNRTSRLGPRG
jgi:quercetin dioxygenase-like cupin family protein